MGNDSDGASSYPGLRVTDGARDLQTTLGYMHLAKDETERAIGLLETPIAGSSVHGNGNLTARELMVRRRPGQKEDSGQPEITIEHQSGTSSTDADPADVSDRAPKYRSGRWTP
jgi:hypothetical protein